jgi:hypothetical protein
VSIGIETPAVEMAVGETPGRRFTDLVLVSVGIETPGGIFTDIVPVSVGIKTPAVKMAVGETPCRRFTDLVQDSVGIETLAVEMAARRRAVELPT